MSETEEKAPYELGDIVAVLIHPLFENEPRWVPAMVMECDKPKGASRYLCKTAVGMSKNTMVVANRIYCGPDGRGEEIVPLNENVMSFQVEELNGAPLLSGCWARREHRKIDAEHGVVHEEK